MSIYDYRLEQYQGSDSNRYHRKIPQKRHTRAAELTEDDDFGQAEQWNQLARDRQDAEAPSQAV